MNPQAEEAIRNAIKGEKKIAQTILSFLDDEFKSLTEINDFLEQNVEFRKRPKQIQSFFVTLKIHKASVGGKESTHRFLIGVYKSMKKARCRLLHFFQKLSRKYHFESENFEIETMTFDRVKVSISKPFGEVSPDFQTLIENIYAEFADEVPANFPIELRLMRAGISEKRTFDLRVVKNEGRKIEI